MPPETCDKLVVTIPGRLKTIVKKLADRLLGKKELERMIACRGELVIITWAVNLALCAYACVPGVVQKMCFVVM